MSQRTRPQVTKCTNPAHAPHWLVVCPGCAWFTVRGTWGEAMHSANGHAFGHALLVEVTQP